MCLEAVLRVELITVICGNVLKRTPYRKGGKKVALEKEKKKRDKEAKKDNDCEDEKGASQDVLVPAGNKFEETQIVSALIIKQKIN